MFLMDQEELNQKKPSACLVAVPCPARPSCCCLPGISLREFPTLGERCFAELLAAIVCIYYVYTASPSAGQGMCTQIGLSSSSRDVFMQPDHPPHLVSLFRQIARYALMTTRGEKDTHVSSVEMLLRTLHKY